MVRRVRHTPKEAIVHKLCEYAADHATQKATILQQHATINILTAEMAALHSTVSQLQATFHLATEQARTEQQETLLATAAALAASEKTLSMIRNAVAPPHASSSLLYPVLV